MESITRNKVRTFVISLSLLVTYLMPGSAPAATIATFDDPTSDSSTPLFTIDLAANRITGGWNDDQTNLDLEVTIASSMFYDAYFTMADVEYYGDMSGGLAPIGDVLKTTVYDLAAQLRAEGGGNRIPPGVFSKPPSAELKPDQTDQDKLPPYDVLDDILARYIEQDQTVGQIIADGVDAETARRVVGMVDATEYKRKQAPPTLKVSPRAFGSGRRMPIAQGYRA